MIVHEDDEWILYTRDGSRVLGRHETYEKAMRQERAILWSIKNRKNPAALYEHDRSDTSRLFGYFPEPNSSLPVGEATLDIYLTFEHFETSLYAPDTPEDVTRLKGLIGADVPIGLGVDAVIYPEFRDQGFGKKLIKECVEYLITQDDAKVKSVLLVVDNVNVNNFSLQEWYASQGFVDLDMVTKSGYPLMLLN